MEGKISFISIHTFILLLFFLAGCEFSHYVKLQGRFMFINSPEPTDRRSAGTHTNKNKQETHLIKE